MKRYYIIVLIVMMVIGGIFLLKKGYDKEKTEEVRPTLSQNPIIDKNESVEDNTSSSDRSSQSEISPPLLVKTIGVNIDFYDKNTGKAGDFIFTKQKLQFNSIFMDYGFLIPMSVSETHEVKKNPQPTFILPLGTKVLSLVDGVVVGVPKLYSDDYSIMVAKDKNSQWIYETEHVINPLVRVGDTVRAGQIIAEVSTLTSQYNAGFGLVEIGIFKGGQVPEHICPFAYLDPSIRNDTLNKITALYRSWEEYRGDSTIYNESEHVQPGCLTLEPIEG